jgi:hypothetical protein
MAPIKDKSYKLKFKFADFVWLFLLGTLVALVWKHEEHKCLCAIITYFAVANVTQSLMNKGVWAIITDMLKTMKEMNSGNKNRTIS